ncbi:VOC family protein [Nocardioides litoris]|uniref:VOC family protein n=1 Tax=Nocardioides litoris TaxID=1926648 RepID=UPI0011246F26|nr:VOC family protein [Nocardioides litoris]
MTDAIAPLQGLHHVRLTVTDIRRSKAFYTSVLGSEPAMDFSDEVDEPGTTEDQEKLYGGCVFDLGGQLLGLRPVAQAGDRFDSTRVGLDHVSLQVGRREDLDAAARRLDEAGIEHGEVYSAGAVTILSFQDPDDINLELTFAG